MRGGEEVESKEWYLSAYAPEGVPTSDHLKLQSVRLSLAVDSIPEGHVAVEMLWISVEPYSRTRMSGIPDGLHLPQLSLNQTVTTFGIGRVIRSKNSSYAEGDIVVNPFSPVAEYCVVPPDFLRKVDPTDGIELPYYLSCLGLPGFAAWVGIEVLGCPKAGSNVFISAAGGGVGMVAGQLAKIKSCRVVGSTGSDEKVKLLKEELGFDDAFNYNKETNFDAALSKYFPEGIDVYFDNVGGKMLEAVLNHVNSHARIALCGMVSQYNEVWTRREGVRNLLNAVGKEVRMEGFMVGSYLDRFGDFAEEVERYVKQGMIKAKHKVYIGIESFLDSLASLFSSSNAGKVLIQVKP
ncbi:2-alkenal reductase (NADP(+)-dependent)-like [Malania oleifera]|uniref:2-alkenal reductase (NADP(+)-dependent)-like n=1 Tax=Malania oleifera TaxID=397392 RepID=UPI0025AE714F|nr:2-alkenal reductase (NADP(+)-dependent)-like [Malania oleifera]